MADNNKKTILVVAGKKGDRKPLCKKLVNEGYNCLEANNANQALEKMAADNIDLVLLDSQITGKSKQGPLTEIKERYQDVAVVITIGADDLDTAKELMKHGADDYISKPFSPDEVVHSVNKAIEKRRLELKLSDYRQYIDQRIAEQAKESYETFLRAMASLASALEARDSYTTGHSHRVADTAIAIGKILNLEQDELEDLHWGSLVHDIGKIAVDRSIMNKADKLTSKEYDHVMSHTSIGANIVESVTNNKRISEAIEHHHAHYDGNGLNQKIKGEEIPLLASIIAVADAYDAMTSARPYRAAWSSEAAIAEIKWESNKQFDPRIVNAFLEMTSTDKTKVSEKRKILVADNEEGVKQLVRSALGSDYTVIEANSGQEAIEATHSQKPALIFLDTLMPGKDGLRTLYEIKTNSATKSIPVVMLTDESQHHNRIYSTELGADQCITKPLSTQDLVDTVDQFLKGYK